MKIRKYLYLFITLFLLTISTSCSLIKNIKVNVYDGNGTIIETLTVNKGYKLDLARYGVPEKESDEQYDYYFKGWSCEDIVTIKGSLDIYPEYEKYPTGLIFTTYYSSGKNEDAYYLIKEYSGNHTYLEIPEKVGYPLKKSERIKTYLPVQIILENAFKNNTTLEEVVLPEGITKIKYSAFSRCENIKSINIPSTVQSIEEDAFGRCRSLKEINLQRNANISLGNDVFYDCESLEKAHLPNTLTTIPEGLFGSCINLENVYIDSEITKVCEDSFYKCAKLDLSFIDFSKLEVIESNAFSYCNVPAVLDLTNVEYSGYAFSYCDSIEEIIFNKNTEIIEGFNYCHNLSKINFSELVNLKEISGLSDSNIKTFDFSQNQKIEELDISNTDTPIEELILHHDIKYRPSAKKTVILNGQIVGKFSSVCEEIILPEGITEITEKMFSKCQNLRVIIVPSTVTSIGDLAFEDCSSLQTITIPKSVTSIGTRAFSGCSNLEQVIFEDGNKIKIIKNGTFEFCYKLYDINIEKCQELEIIEEGAFYSCEALTNFAFDKLSKLTTIEDMAFKGTNIRIMKLPTKLVSLGTDLPTLLSFVYVPSSLNYSFNLKDVKIIKAYQTEPSGNSSNTNIYKNISFDKVHYDNEGFVYILNQDLTATIIRYCGLKRDIVTPDEITVNGKKYVVNTIGSYAFSGDFITALKISDSVTSVSGFLFDGLEYNYALEIYISLRILSVGTNYEFNLITKYETLTGINVITGYREQWLSPFNIINSVKDTNIKFESNRYQLNNLISGESLNSESTLYLGTKTHVNSTVYETYPSYKEVHTEYTNDYLSPLNDIKYDLEYIIIDDFIFSSDQKACLGYIGEYKNKLELPKLEEAYTCYFIINDYYCGYYEANENVTFQYK